MPDAIVRELDPPGGKPHSIETPKVVPRYRGSADGRPHLLLLEPGWQASRQLCNGQAPPRLHEVVLLDSRVVTIVIHDIPTELDIGRTGKSPKLTNGDSLRARL